MGASCALQPWLGHINDEIFTGARFYPGHKVSRKDRPRGFYFYMTQWMVLTAAFVTWGIAILLGFAQPMPSGNPTGELITSGFPVNLPERQQAPDRVN